MAISTYSELQTAVATWLVRSDMTARIPEFIALAEAHLNRVLRARRAETEASLTATAGARTISLPATHTEALACWLVIEGDRKALVPADPNIFAAVSLQGEPQRYAIDGTNLAFERPCDQAYDVVLRYLAKFALSDAAPTNALLTEAPDVYLWGAVAEGAAMGRSWDLEARAIQRRDAAIRAVNVKDARNRAQPLRTELTGVLGGHIFNIERDQ